MSGPPSFAVKKKIMRTLAGRRINTPDLWEYAVAKSWLLPWQSDEYRSFCESETKPESFTMISKRPSMNSETQLSSMQPVFKPEPQTSRPVVMSESDSENTYVPETQWKLYCSWFGLDRKHQLRRRPSDSQHVYNEQVWKSDTVDREMDFLPVWACFLEEVMSVGKPRHIDVFAWDTLRYIETQVRRVLDIDRKRTIRLWFYMKYNNETFVLEPINNLNQSLLDKIMKLVPDVRVIMETRQPRCISPCDFYSETKTEVRQRLSEVLFGDNNILRHSTIALAVEVVGFALTGKTAEQGEHPEACLEDNLDSILTISSIHNEWDDILATHFENYVEDMGDRTQEIKERSARNFVGEKIDELIEIKTNFEIRFAGLAKQETAVKTRENAVTEQEKDLNERLSRFNTELMDFQQKQRQHADEFRPIESQNKIASLKIVLNVGGTLFSTSLTTVTSGEKNSMLAMMFSDRHSLHQESDGSYFIDRDGTNFRYILNYLRDGDTYQSAYSMEPNIISDLLAEADFYKLPRLKKLLNDRWRHVHQK